MYSIKFEHQKLILFKWLDSLWYICLRRLRTLFGKLMCINLISTFSQKAALFRGLPNLFVHWFVFSIIHGAEER